MQIDNALAKYEDLTHEIFATDGAIEPILAAIREQTLSQVYDAEDEKARKAANALARKLGGFKTKVDDLGKTYVAEAKAKIKKVDDRRKFWRDGIEQIQADFKKPADEWQQRENARIAAIDEKLARIRTLGVTMTELGQPHGIEHLEQNLAELTQINLAEDDYQEKLPAAQAEMGKSMQALNGQISALKKAEQERKAEEEKRIAAERERIREEERQKLAQEKPAAEPVIEVSQPAPVPEKVVEIEVEPKKPASSAVMESILMINCQITRDQAKKVIAAVSAGKIPGMAMEG